MLYFKKVSEVSIRIDTMKNDDSSKQQQQQQLDDVKEKNERHLGKYSSSTSTNSGYARDADDESKDNEDNESASNHSRSGGGKSCSCPSADSTYSSTSSSSTASTNRSSRDSSSSSKQDECSTSKRTKDEPEPKLEQAQNESRPHKRPKKDTTAGTGTGTGTASNSTNNHRSAKQLQRQQRNAREKRRSNQICDQFDSIRDLITKGGVVVPRGTKGMLLQAARDYILLLQKEQRKTAMYVATLLCRTFHYRINSVLNLTVCTFLYFTELIYTCRDNGLLVHQMQCLEKGAMGNMATQVARQMINKNDVSHIVWANGSKEESFENSFPVPSAAPPPPTTTTEADFVAAFQHLSVPMAIATLGGSFVDCNDRFRKYAHELVATHTVGDAAAAADNFNQKRSIFNLIAKNDLQKAFLKISDWLTPSHLNQDFDSPIVLQSVLSTDVTLCLTPIKRPNDSSLRFLCMTLVMNNANENSNNNNIHSEIPTQTPAMTTNDTEETNKRAWQQHREQKQVSETISVSKPGRALPYTMETVV